MQRRQFLQAGALPLLSLAPPASISSLPASEHLHTSTASLAAQLAKGRDVTLNLMYPAGCLANIRDLAAEFRQRTGINIALSEVPLAQINDELLIEAEAREGSFDIALPATFGVPDLVESGILLNLDRFASRYEPNNFQDDALFSVGDYYKGSLYGYQADGDSYMMFYLKDWLENPDAAKAFADRHGYPLAKPRTWEQLDQMMAFFHAPSEGRFGGSLYRTEFFVAWEWWSRFHAKGRYPLADDLTPQIDSAEGIAALEELIAASRHLTPGARKDGLFANFESFGRGQTFCNIGWGGTQKYLNGPQSKVRGNLCYGPTPGGVIDGEHFSAPYFNWGRNYVVSAISDEPELAYLFTLFASSPEMSTQSVRNRDGYFDPFRRTHYRDATIRATYSDEFLNAHERSMRDAIPDLYLKGQAEYFDELRLNIRAADAGEKTPTKAMRDTARAWQQITERMGPRCQRGQWAFLKSRYPASAKRVLR